MPIHGAVVAERKGVVDSEIVLTWTAARLAVLLDNLVEQEWQRLVDDPDYRNEQSRKSAKTELKAMADILIRAKQVGRSITPVGIPVDDVFDLLDEELLKQRFERFPGHEKARAAHLTPSPAAWRRPRSRASWRRAPARERLGSGAAVRPAVAPRGAVFRGGGLS